MKQFLLTLAALCGLLVPGIANARVIDITLSRAAYKLRNLSNFYGSGDMDTTDFRPLAGDTIRAVVGQFESYFTGDPRVGGREIWFAGQINLQTTNGDSIIIPEGVTILTNALWNFLQPTRIGQLGGRPVKFIATGLRTTIKDEDAGYDVSIDRDAGLVVRKGLLAYGLDISGFTEAGPIKIAHGATMTLYDGRTKNRRAFQVPTFGAESFSSASEWETNPTTGDITINTIRHSFEDSVSYLSFLVDLQDVIYTDVGSRFGPARIGISFTGYSRLSSPSQMAEYLARYQRYHMTFDGSISDIPIDQRLIDEYAPYQAEITPIVRARVTVIAPAPAVDWNNDGTVGFGDFILFAAAFGKPAAGDQAKFDLDKDSTVGFGDFILFAAAFNKRAGKPAMATPAQLAELAAIARRQPELLPAIEMLWPRRLYPELYAQLAGAKPPVVELAQNFPNPFNPTTIIAYALPEQAAVELVIYNLAGQAVRTLVAARQRAGRYEINWNATDERGSPVATGIYFYRLTAGSRVETRRMLFLK